MEDRDVRPMTLTIELSDEQATGLQTKAAAEGLSLEEWLQKLAEQESKPASRPHRRHISEVFCDNMREVPPEILAAMPERWREPA
jgi:hypothetical protein